jgi:hypothetical protein
MNVSTILRIDSETRLGLRAGEIPVTVQQVGRLSSYFVFFIIELWVKLLHAIRADGMRKFG